MQILYETTIETRITRVPYKTLWTLYNVYKQDHAKDSQYTSPRCGLNGLRYGTIPYGTVLYSTCKAKGKYYHLSNRRVYSFR